MHIRDPTSLIAHRLHVMRHRVRGRRPCTTPNRNVQLETRSSGPQDAKAPQGPAWCVYSDAITPARIAFAKSHASKMHAAAKNGIIKAAAAALPWSM